MAAKFHERPRINSDPNAPIPLARKDIEANIQIGNAFCQFTPLGDIIINGELTSDQMAGIAMINEILRRLRSGRLVQYDFDPIMLDNEERLVHCEWLKSGNLKIHKNNDGSLEIPTRRWNHAWTRAEAMSRARGFTCTLSLLQMLPRRRVGVVVKELTAEQMSGDTVVVDTILQDEYKEPSDGDSSES